jgi:hypothetical protein
MLASLFNPEDRGGLPLWSSGPEVRVHIPVLADFLRNGGAGRGSTQPREYSRGATWNKK